VWGGVKVCRKRASAKREMRGARIKSLWWNRPYGVDVRRYGKMDGKMARCKVTVASCEARPEKAWGFPSRLRTAGRRPDCVEGSPTSQWMSLMQ
jgi:hypothetical protein